MENDFKNLNNAKALINDARELEEFHDKFKEATRKGNRESIDKFAKGFNRDDRFKSFKAEIYFSAYIGSWSSSVSSFLHLESDSDINESLIKYLQDNEEDIIKGMASILDKKAKELVSEALIEVANAQIAINEIKAYDPISENNHG